MSSKIAGFNHGGITVEGDTGTLVTDGSIVIGNADTDTCTINADFISNLVPNDATSYTLGTASKPWRQVYLSAGLVHANANGNTTTLQFETPSAGDQTFVIRDITPWSYPNNTTTIAIDGNQPSYLSFGKNGSLTAPETGFELTTINGAQNGAGWCMPTNGVVTHISFQCACTSVGSGNQIEVVLTKNAAEQTNYKIVVQPSETGRIGGSVNFYQQPLMFQPNDAIGLIYKSTVSSGTLTTTDHACLVRVLD